MSLPPPIPAQRNVALDELFRLGGQVKVSYETRSTRLHAKAWLFHRQTGFSTAYIGSSNLTQWAMLDGVEWNVRLSQVTRPDILEKFRAMFDSYWKEPDFEEYDPNRDRSERVPVSLTSHRRQRCRGLYLALLAMTSGAAEERTLETPPSFSWPDLRQGKLVLAGRRACRQTPGIPPALRAVVPLG